MQKKSLVPMRKRASIMMALIILVGFVTVTVRLYIIQVVDGEMYQAKASKLQMKSVTINANRGKIFDRNMTVLAQSATVWNLILSPKECKKEDIPKIADEVNVLLGVDKEKVIKASQKDWSMYEEIKKKLDRETKDKLVKFIDDNNISGLYLIEDTKRYYPFGNFAAALLGFTNDDNHGAYGIEAYYDKVLSGTPGKLLSSKNGVNVEMPLRYQQMFEAKDGNSLVLTIDETIQHFLEKNLETAIVEYGVKNRATGIIMDVTTGEILAMATKSDYNPNNPREIGDPIVLKKLDEEKALNGEDAYKKAVGQAQFEQWRNKAISDPYEPGSVFKLITTAMALETNSVKLTDHFYCPGYHIVADRRISCWKTQGHGDQDFTTALMNSCNPAFMMIGARVGGEQYYNYFEAFGLTEPTGIDIPGEASNKGLYHSKAALTNGVVELASSSFGQTFKVTPIQILTAVAAAVNGGKLMQPYVVKQVLDANGNVIQTNEPIVKRQVISEQTSKTVAAMAEKVVSAGSGKNAYIPGYRIGGKTGTSEKIDQKKDGVVKDYILSFLGFAPADAPKVICLVLLDETYQANYGSQTAAPLVGAILSDVLPYLGIEPQYTAAELEKFDVKTPYVTDMLPHYAQAQLTQKGLRAKIIGSGSKVVKQVPSSGQPIPKGGTVLLYTDEQQASAAKVTVPNVVGMSGLQANKVLTNAGLNIKISGVSVDGEMVVVAKQSIEPNTQVDEGTVITIDLKSKEALD
ncbi:MAG TPA: stage V sporulation protein D [Ruminococcaceae bacterium]|nr:stage V sporulation protein D [Oscillospiraceae bacterium]